MTEEDEFPHFTHFLHQIQQNQPVEITEEVNNEIIKLLTGYEENKSQTKTEEFKKLVDMLESYEQEHEILKGDLKRKNTQIEQTKQIKTDLEQIIDENQKQIQILSTDHENKIFELNEKIKHLQKDNDFLNEKLKQYNKEMIKSKQEFQEEASNANELEIENISLKSKIEKMKTSNEQQIVTLTQALEDKKIECDNLRLNLKQTTQKFQKQKSAVMFLKQQSKGDEQIIRNMKKEVNEAKEQLSIYKESSEKRFEKEDKLIVELIQMIQEKDFNKEKLEKLINSFDKRKLLFKFPNPQTDRLSARAIDKIKEYEMENFEESQIDFEPESNNISFHPNETMQTVRLSSDNHNFSHFKMDESINLETPQKGKLLEDLQIESTHKIDRQRNSKLRDSKNDISSLKKKFEMDLDKQINLKRNPTLKSIKTPLTISNPVKFGSQLCFQKAEHKQDETLKHNYSKQKQNILDNLEVSNQEFEQGLTMLEKICNDPEKNPTTFIIQDFDKKQLRNKFIRSKTKNLRRYVSLFIKLFIYQINYLEGKISTLTYNNSCLDLSLQNKKDELNFLLAEFLKKNAQNQELLNRINENLMKMRKNNNKKLKQCKNEKFEFLKNFTDDSSFQDESINKQKISSHNNTSILSNTKFQKKSVLQNSKNLLSDDQISIKKSIKDSEANETDNEKQMLQLCNETIEDSVIEVSYIYNLQDYNQLQDQLRDLQKEKAENTDDEKINGIDIEIKKIETEMQLIKQSFDIDPLKRFTGCGFLTFRNINYALLFRNLYLKSQGKSLNNLKKTRVIKNMEKLRNIVKKLQVNKQLRLELMNLDQIDKNSESIQKRRQSIMNSSQQNTNKIDFSSISNILYKQEIRDMDKEKIEFMRCKFGENFKIFQVTDVQNLNFNFKQIRNYSNLELFFLFLVFVIVLPYLAYVFNWGYFYHDLIYVNADKLLIGEFIVKMIYLIFAVGLDIATLEIISRIFNKNNFIDTSLMYQYKLFSSIFYLMLTNIILPNVGLKDALAEFVEENDTQKNHFQITHLTSVVDFTIKLFLFSNFNQKFIIPFVKQKFFKQKIERNIVDEMIFNIIFVVNSVFWVSHFSTIRQSVGILFLLTYILYIGLDYYFVLSKAKKDNRTLPTTIISNSIIILVTGIYPACLIGYYSITQYFEHILNPTIYSNTIVKKFINFVLGLQINSLKFFYFLDGQNKQTPRVLLFKLIDYFRSFSLETTYLLFTDFRFIVTTTLYAVAIIYFIQEFSHMRFLDRLKLKTKSCLDFKMNDNIKGQSFRSANPAYSLLSKEKKSELEEDMKKYK